MVKPYGMLLLVQDNGFIDTFFWAILQTIVPIKDPVASTYQEY